MYEWFESYYDHHNVLDYLERSVHRRLFQKLHRWRDEKKKIKNPRRVTLYDILDYYNRK